MSTLLARKMLNRSHFAAYLWTLSLGSWPSGPQGSQILGIRAPSTNDPTNVCAKCVRRNVAPNFRCAEFCADVCAEFWVCRILRRICVPNFWRAQFFRKAILPSKIIIFCRQNSAQKFGAKFGAPKIRHRIRRKIRRTENSAQHFGAHIWRTHWLDRLYSGPGSQGSGIPGPASRARSPRPEFINKEHTVDKTTYENTSWTMMSGGSFSSC